MLPGVLLAAGHAKNDMASEVRLARQRYPHVTFHMGRALDVLPRLTDEAYDLLFVDALLPEYPSYHQQGVRLLRLDAGDKLVSVARVVPDDEVEEGEPVPQK